jgi:hypothetical protein
VGDEVGAMVALDGAKVGTIVVGDAVGAVVTTQLRCSSAPSSESGSFWKPSKQSQT